MSNYVKRKISLTFNLKQGTFPPPATEGSNSVTVSGLRTSVVITKGGEVGLAAAQVRVNGLSLSVMNQLTTLGKPTPGMNGNTLIIAAGNADSANLPTVFIGNINAAWADLQAAPDAALIVSAFTGAASDMEPVAPTSYSGAVDVVTVMSDFATRLGLTLENSLTDVPVLSNPYYPGTLGQQIASCARHAHVGAKIDDRVLALFPLDGARRGGIPLVNAASGLIGYPTYTDGGMILSSLYNPEIRANGKIKVESDIKPACGEWIVFAITHELEAETPGGAWRTTMRCQNWGHEAT